MFIPLPPRRSTSARPRDERRCDGPEWFPGRAQIDRASFFCRSTARTNAASCRSRPLPRENRDLDGKDFRCRARANRRAEFRKRELRTDEWWGYPEGDLRTRDAVHAASHGNGKKSQARRNLAAIHRRKCRRRAAYRALAAGNAHRKLSRAAEGF